MIRRASPDTDQISRSLLQKAVRRGDVKVTEMVINYIIKINDFDWLRKRLAVVTFEECWPYGLKISYEKDEETVLNHYLNIAKTSKNKNAAGLGSLAYAFSKGELTVLNGHLEDSAIKIVGEAIKRPNDFWQWIYKQKLNEIQKTLVFNADKGFRKAGWPWDRAFTLAAAYLAMKDEIPPISFSETNRNIDFPFWVGIDKHTKEGKVAIRTAAKKIGFNSNKALWLAFYFESAKCNAIDHSPWWEREIAWRMKKLELSMDIAKMTWERMKPIIVELLGKEAQKLKERMLSTIEPKSQVKIKQRRMF